MEHLKLFLLKLHEFEFAVEHASRSFVFYCMFEHTWWSLTDVEIFEIVKLLFT